MEHIHVNGDKDVVEKAKAGDGTSAEDARQRETVESLIANFILNNRVTVISSTELLAHARSELGDGLPGDRLNLALGFLAFSGLVSYSEATGRVEINRERREQLRRSLVGSP